MKSGSGGDSDYVILDISDTVINSNSPEYNEAILTKKQIKSLISGQGGNYVSKSGDVMSGNLSINATPSEDAHAATVEWVKGRALIVPTANPGDDGALWSSGGVLYWNKR